MKRLKGRVEMKSWKARGFPLLLGTLLVFGTLLTSVRAADEGLEVATLKRTAPVDFVVDILPFLRKNCIACHNESEAKGDVVLETVPAILAGIDGDAMVEPGDGAGSILFQVAGHRARPPMPPKRNKVGAKPLSPEELALLKMWIDQGAKESEGGARQEAEWYRQPQGIQPIYCAAVTEDARFAACGRANRLTVYPLFAADQSTRLSDPAVAKSELYQGAPAAHFDNVQAVSFHPDGELLVSGGYRNVKIWEREDFATAVALRLPQAGDVTALVRSADAAKLAAGSASGHVMVWSAGDPNSLESSKVFDKAVTAVVFGGDGQVVSSSVSGKLAVGVGGSVAVVDGGSPALALAVVGKERSRVVSGHQDGRLRLWTLKGGELAADSDLRKEGSSVSALVALPGAADQFVAGSEDGVLRLVGVADGKTVREWSHGAAVTALAARTDGRVASAGADKTLRVWGLQVEGDKPAETVASLGNPHDERLRGRQTRLVALYRLRLDDAKKAVEAGTKDVEEKTKALEAAGKAVVEKEKALADRKKEVAEGQAPLEKVKATVTDLEKRVKDLTPEEKPKDGDAKKKEDAETPPAEGPLAEAQKALEAATKARDELANKDKEARKKEAAATSELARAQENQKGAVENLDRAKKKLAAAKVQPAKRQTELNAGDVLLTQLTTKTNAQSGLISALSFSPDGGVIAGVVDGHGARLWSAETGQVMATLAGAGAKLAVEFLGNDEMLVQTEASSLTSWSLNPRWKLTRTIGDLAGPSAFPDRVTALRFSPDGKTLLTASGEPSRDGEFTAWSTSDWSVKWKAEHAHSDSIFALDYTLDGKLIASCGADKVVRVWNAEDGATVKAFEGHTSHVLGVSWRFDSKVLASCGADNVIKVWDFESGRQLRTIGGFKKQVTALRFVGDLSQIIACSGDKIVRLHNADDGKAIRDFEGVADYMYTLDVPTDGGVVASGGFDGALRLWNVKTGAALGSLAPRVTRRF
jgi:WD40 repeat protein